MNNKMAIHTYLSTIDFKKQTKQTRTKTDRIMDKERILMVARREGLWGLRGEGMKKHK